jgi:hypothetical protein
MARCARSTRMTSRTAFGGLAERRLPPLGDLHPSARRAYALLRPSTPSSAVRSPHCSRAGDRSWMPTMRELVRLDDADPTAVDDLDGKAASLVRLMRAGLPVPAGHVLTSAFTGPVVRPDPGVGGVAVARRGSGRHLVRGVRRRTCARGGSPTRRPPAGGPWTPCAKPSAAASSRCAAPRRRRTWPGARRPLAPANRRIPADPQALRMPIEEAVEERQRPACRALGSRPVAWVLRRGGPQHFTALRQLR